MVLFPVGVYVTVGVEFKVRRGLESIPFKPYVPVIREFVRLTRGKLGENLVSIVVFGSVGRGDCTYNSDIDVLVVARNMPDGLMRRIDIFLPIIEAARRKADSRPLIQVYPLSVWEAFKNRPIYLDMLTDAVILYDKDDFMVKVLGRLRRRLESLGARKLRLKDGSWMWILKPDIRLGEAVEI